MLSSDYEYMSFKMKSKNEKEGMEFKYIIKEDYKIINDAFIYYSSILNNDDNIFSIDEKNFN